MKSRGPAKAFTALLTVGALVGTAVPAAAADVRPFQPRFERRVNGDISIVNATSATATASRPAGSTLLFAGLYWGGPAGPARPTEAESLCRSRRRHRGPSSPTCRQATRLADSARSRT